MFAAFLPCTGAGAAEGAPPAVSGDARSVYCPTTPPSAFTLYAFAPELLAAWNTPLRDYEKNLFATVSRPAHPGRWYGQGFIPDREMLLASGIKKAFSLSMSMHGHLPLEQT
jgi:iron complex transport system substrate-binding protein